MNAIAHQKLLFESAAMAVGSTPASQSSDFSPEFMLMQAQMLITKNYDDQIRDVAEKIKFMKEVMCKYRENIATVSKFLAQPTHNSRHDKKPVIDASATQMAELCGALTTYNYNLDSKTMTPVGLEVFDMEARNNINTDESTWDGKTSSLEMKSLFEQMCQAKTPEEYKALADKIGDGDKMQLFFYFTGNVFNNSNRKVAGEGNKGLAVFQVYAESLQGLTKELEAGMAKCEMVVDELTTKLTDLSEKRKASLELANQAVRKASEISSNTVSKM